jgi:uncharacterized membrane protein YqjE
MGRKEETLMNWLVIFPDWLLYSIFGLMTLWALVVLWLAWHAFRYTRGLYDLIAAQIEAEKTA